MTEDPPWLVPLTDLKTTGGDLTGMAITQFGCKTVIPLDQGDATGRRFQQVNREGTHAGTNLDEMIPGSGFRPGNNRPGEIRIQEKILPEHFAWPHPDLIKSGTEVGFVHEASHNPLERLVPVAILNGFFAFVPKLFTTLPMESITGAFSPFGKADGSTILPLYLLTLPSLSKGFSSSNLSA